MARLDQKVLLPKGASVYLSHGRRPVPVHLRGAPPAFRHSTGAGLGRLVALSQFNASERLRDITIMSQKMPQAHEHSRGLEDPGLFVPVSPSCPLVL